MTTDPWAWVEPFVDAGADGVIFCFDSLTRSRRRRSSRSRIWASSSAISLLVTEPVSLLRPYWKRSTRSRSSGRRWGPRGRRWTPSIFDKIREARAAIEKLGCTSRSRSTAASGAIPCRKSTAAGADWIVPGSLMFGEDPAAMRKWLGSL